MAAFLTSCVFVVNNGKKNIYSFKIVTKRMFAKSSRATLVSMDVTNLSLKGRTLLLNCGFYLGDNN